MHSMTLGQTNARTMARNAGGNAQSKSVCKKALKGSKGTLPQKNAAMEPMIPKNTNDANAMSARSQGFTGFANVTGRSVVMPTNVM